MKTHDASKLAPHDLLRFHLVAALDALRAAKPIPETLPDIALARLPHAICDAAAIVSTCLAHCQHADDVRKADNALRDSQQMQREQTLTHGVVQR